jgi:hypothetical protein
MVADSCARHKDMVQDEKYFDKLFFLWYESQKAKNAVKN